MIKEEFIIKILSKTIFVSINIIKETNRKKLHGNKKQKRKTGRNYMETKNRKEKQEEITWRQKIEKEE